MADSTSLSGRNLLAFIPFVTKTLIDNARVGTFQACMGRTVNTTDTVLSHTLGRTPNGYIMIRSSGGTLYDATTGITAWTDKSITLRASLAGTYSFLLL